MLTTEIKKKFLSEAKKTITLLYYSEITTLKSWESPTPGLSLGSFQMSEAFILHPALWIYEHFLIIIKIQKLNFNDSLIKRRDCATIFLTTLSASGFYTGSLRLFSQSPVITFVQETRHFLRRFLRDSLTTFWLSWVRDEPPTVRLLLGLGANSDWLRNRACGGAIQDLGRCSPSIAFPSLLRSSFPPPYSFTPSAKKKEIRNWY